MTLDNVALGRKWWFAIPVMLATIFSQEWIFRLAGYDTNKVMPISEILFNVTFLAELCIGFSVFFTLWRFYSFLGGVFVFRLYPRVFKHAKNLGE